jgi:HPt (histidine-containing phosphotransfer) domain-containing protein
MHSSMRPADAEPLVSELRADPDIADLVREFVPVLAEGASALRVAMASGDVDTVKRVLHQLKGAAGGYGFPTITAEARHVERVIADDDAPKSSDAIEAFCQLCCRAVP